MWPAGADRVAGAGRERHVVLPVELIVEVPVGAAGLQEIPPVLSIPSGGVEGGNVEDDAFVQRGPAFIAMAAAADGGAQAAVEAVLDRVHGLPRAAHHLHVLGPAHPALIEAADERR